MKKIVLLLLISAGANAQFDRIGFPTYENFNVSASIDPMGSIDTESINATLEIEYEGKGVYVKAGTQFNPGLEGGYIDVAGGVGLNLKAGLNEDWRYYAGLRAGFIKRGATHPLFGFEAGVRKHFDKFFIGARATYDYRTDMEFWDGIPQYRFNGSITIGTRF